MCGTVQSRLDAMDTIVREVDGGVVNNNASAVIQSIAFLPGWDEKNFQVSLPCCSTRCNMSLVCDGLGR